jgi:hypothetical protein
MRIVIIWLDIIVFICSKFGGGGNVWTDRGEERSQDKLVNSLTLNKNWPKRRESTSAVVMLNGNEMEVYCRTWRSNNS